MEQIKVKYLDGYLPELEKKAGDCGYDLRAVIKSEVVIGAGESYVIPTGIALAMPDGVGGFVFPRSGLGCKGLVLRNLTGVIDSNYRGEVKVCVWNTSSEPMAINPYDRIAQIVFMPYISGEIKEVEELPSSERGSNGFGSSGVE